MYTEHTLARVSHPATQQPNAWGWGSCIPGKLLYALLNCSDYANCDENYDISQTRHALQWIVQRSFYKLEGSQAKTSK